MRRARSRAASAISNDLPVISGSGATRDLHSGMTHDARGSPPWCFRLTRELDIADARAGALVSGLTIAQLNWKPGPEAWSLGQCLEHLCLSNEVYIEPIAASLGSPGDGPVDEIMPGWFGRWFIRTYIDP